MLVDGELPLDAAGLRPVIFPDCITHAFADGVGQSVVFGVFRAVLSLAILEDLDALFCVGRQVDCNDEQTCNVKVHMHTM